MAKRRGKGPGKETFIERTDRPPVVDYEQPVENITLRELVELVDARVEEQVARHRPPVSLPEQVKPEIVKPEQYKPEQYKPEQFKPEQYKPEQFKPEQYKPEQYKPEQYKPEQFKPEQLKPERLKPEQLKEHFKPEQLKPEQLKEHLKPEHLKPDLLKEEFIKPEGLKELSKPEGMPTLDRTLPVTKIGELVRGAEAELIAGIELLAGERARRIQERTPVTVLTYDSDAEDSLRLLLPGTATLFVTAAGSPLLDDIARVFGGSDEAAVTALVDRLQAEAAHRSRVSPLAAAQELAAGRAFGTIRYGDRVLAENLGLPNGIEFGAISFPYAGGDLDPERFVLDQYVRGTFQERIDGVVVVRPARLSDAERAAIELISPETREIGISDPGHLAVTVTTVTIALFVVAVHTPTLTGGMWETQFRTRLDRLAVDAERVARLKSPLAVAELVALRRELQAELF